MKITLFTAFLALSTSVWAAPPAPIVATASLPPLTLEKVLTAPVRSPPRPNALDLEMTGAEYRSILESHPALRRFTGQGSQDLQPILDTGKRNLDWLKFINDHRDGAHKISLTSKATQSGIPITKPKKYNPALIRAGYEKLLAKLPANFKAIVVDGAPFTADPQMSDSAYASVGHELDKAYQMAARWFMMAPHIDYLTRAKARDIRGYYFLSQDPDVKIKLTNWTQNSAENQDLLKQYLLSMCLNAAALDCPSLLDTAVNADLAYDFYQRYYAAAKAVYERFFTIDLARVDVSWSPSVTTTTTTTTKSTPAVSEEMHVPFVDPGRDDLRHFLADNIQDEWKWSNWQLFLDFVADRPDTAHLKFQAGAVPHVDGLAGSTITMDENQPLTEYNIQWTIRHEFGHVIGFPDCYIEFYEETEKAIVNYQIDITNVMCSRKGVIQQRHYDELKRVYGRR